jgi:hypothetical protein
MSVARRGQIVRLASRFVAIAIALSFVATLLPIAASSANAAMMACCVGKTAGHCESGLNVEKAPQFATEPMCGLETNLPDDDGITIVAESSDNQSHPSFHPDGESTSSRLAAESFTLSQPCHSDCCACVGSARQQKRQPIAQAIARYGSTFDERLRFNNHSHFFSSNKDWEQTSPRGPPANFL